MNTKTLAHLGATMPGALYVLSPLDAIPDFIPVAGQADDAGVILMMVAINLLIMLLLRDGGDK